jgi:hypothetical protein
MNLLDNTTFTIDGHKLLFNAAKKKSGSFDNLRKNQQKFREKISDIIKRAKYLDAEENDVICTKSMNFLLIE